MKHKLFSSGGTNSLNTFSIEPLWRNVMDKGKILEIVELARNVADIIPTNSNDAPKVTNLFQQFRSLASVCMQGLDLRADLKDLVPASQFGELYSAVRYFHSASHYSIDMANQVRQKAITIANILEQAALKAQCRKEDITMGGAVVDTWIDIQKEYDITKKAFGKKINFVTDSFKRKIIFRDVEQAYLLANSGFYKSAVILSGSVIEELLRLYLQHKGITPPRNNFDGYVKVCEENGLIKSAVHRLTESVRQFRNFVHLEKELSSRHTISKATAKGAVSSIFTITNDFQ